MKLTLGICFFCTALVMTTGKALIEEDDKFSQISIKEATESYNEATQPIIFNTTDCKSSRKETLKSIKRSEEFGRIYNIYKSALRDLTSKNKIDRSAAFKYLLDALPSQCQLPEVECNPVSKYRTIDGTCNNLANPHWGATNMPHRRILPPAYTEDDEPRGGRDGGNLPDPRKLSLSVHQGNGTTYEQLATHMVAQFGQFLSHDFSLTPSATASVEKSCCEKGFHLQDCWVIKVEEEDPHYKNRTTCLGFVRSTPVCSSSGIERREQMNELTAYIDGSVVYGSDENHAKILRGSHSGSRLVENSEHKGLLPWKSDIFKDGEHGKVMIAGDIRAEDMPGLTTLQSLFLREHNRIADEFAKLTDWDDERIFQETRRIIGAELQQLTYNEFLPAIIGDAAMEEHGLNLPTQGYTTYNDSVDATIYSSFATAAYRFGHTLVNGLIKLMMNEAVVGTYNIRDNYMHSDQIIKTSNGVANYELILNGLIRQNAQAYDGEIHTDMTNNLFMDRTTQIGTDLAARNIQRGRDHGIPSFNEFRKFCNIPPLTTWDNRPSDFSVNNWEKLKSVYETPDDIDLYTGGLLQTPVKGGLSGRSFICLQAIQFQNLMYGDRFFFTHGNQAGSFTPEQVCALRKRTLGDIICDNSNLTETQCNVFLKASSIENPLTPCTDPNRQLDISLFISTPSTCTCSCSKTE